MSSSDREKPQTTPLDLDDETLDQASGGKLSYADLKHSTMKAGDDLLSERVMGLRERGSPKGIRKLGIRKNGIAGKRLKGV